MARLWNVREGLGSECLVAGVSSVNDVASSMLGRVELKSFDLDDNLHCALAERGDTMDLRPLLEVSTFESCRVFFGLLGDLLAAPHGDDLDSR